MGKKSKNINLYVGISSDEGNHRFGAGWVTTDKKDKKPSYKSKRIPFEHNARNQQHEESFLSAAEVYAVKEALEHVQQSAHISLFTESRAVCNAIALQAFDEEIHRSKNNKPLRKAWEALSEEVRRHDSVTVALSNQNDYPYLKAAHDHARKGVTGALKGGTERQETEKYQKHLKNNLYSEESLDIT